MVHSATDGTLAGGLIYLVWHAIRPHLDWMGELWCDHASMQDRASDWAFEIYGKIEGQLSSTPCRDGVSNVIGKAFAIRHNIDFICRPLLNMGATFQWNVPLAIAPSQKEYKVHESKGICALHMEELWQELIRGESDRYRY